MTLGGKMKHYCVKYSRGQMQIQQMAFVLVAIVIFFAMVALIYISIRMSSLKEDVTTLREQEAKELVKKIASTPELMWGAGCQNCIDFDKLFLLKDRPAYDNFWNLNYLAVEVIFPNKTGECSLSNYPDCKKVTLINDSVNIGFPSTAFVSLCRWESTGGGYEKCELGKIYASGRALE